MKSIYYSSNTDKISNMGVVGSKTNMVDSNGVVLSVGDIVETTRSYRFGESSYHSVVVCENGNEFMMGFESKTKNENFEIFKNDPDTKSIVLHTSHEFASNDAFPYKNFDLEIK